MALAEPRIRTELKSTLKWHMRASFLYRGGQDEGQDDVTHIERGPLIRGFLKWAEGTRIRGPELGKPLGQRLPLAERGRLSSVRQEVRVIWTHNRLRILMPKVERSVSHTGFLRPRSISGV